MTTTLPHVKPTRHTRFRASRKKVVLAAGVFAILAICLAALPATINHYHVNQLGRQYVAAILPNVSHGQNAVTALNKIDNTNAELALNAAVGMSTKDGSDFLLEIHGADGYTWQYDQDSGKISGGCGTLSCFFGQA